jgi:hypothetical protein
LVRKNGGTWKGKRVLKGKRGGDNLDFASKKIWLNPTTA